MKDKSGKVVYTNITRGVFFRAAFKSGYSKSKVLQLIEDAAKRYGVDSALVKAIAKIESDYNPMATSSKSAKGVMQLMDKTAKFYGVEDPYDVEQNIKGGVLFLKHLIEKYHDVRLVAAAYNAGETAVDRYKGIPPYAETRRYVEKFLRVYKGGYRLAVKHRYTHRSFRRIVYKNGVFTNLKAGLW